MNVKVRRKPTEMRCPIKDCDHVLGILSDENGDALPEDTLVTQHTLMALHLQDDHGAVVGGR